MRKASTKAMVRMNGKNFEGSTKEPSKTDAPTLAELGLDKKGSSVALKLAGLPDEIFEQVCDGQLVRD